MAKTTTYMGLVKPDLTDAADITKINTDMDTLDGHVHNGGSSGLAVQMVQNGALSGRPAAGHLGQLYVASDNGGSMAFDNGSAWVQLQNGGSGLTKIAEVILASNVAQVDLSNLPQTYRHLRLEATIRSDAASGAPWCYVRCNSDASANYDTEFAQFWAASQWGSLEYLATTGIVVGIMPSAGGTTGNVGGVSVTFYDYARTAWRKFCSSVAWFSTTDATGGQVPMLGGGKWRSTAALTTISLWCNSGHFVAGSVFTLYGLS